MPVDPVKELRLTILADTSLKVRVKDPIALIGALDDDIANDFSLVKFVSERAMEAIKARVPDLCKLEGYKHLPPGLVIFDIEDADIIVVSDDNPDLTAQFAIYTKDDLDG